MPPPNVTSTLRMWIGTQAEYDALDTKSPDTFYILNDESLRIQPERGIDVPPTNYNGTVTSFDGVQLKAIFSGQQFGSLDAITYKLEHNTSTNGLLSNNSVSGSLVFSEIGDCTQLPSRIDSMSADGDPMYRAYPFDVYIIMQHEDGHQMRLDIYGVEIDVPLAMIQTGQAYTYTASGISRAPHNKIMSQVKEISKTRHVRSVSSNLELF